MLPALSLALAAPLAARPAKQSKIYQTGQPERSSQGTASHTEKGGKGQSFEADQHVYDTLNTVDKLIKERKLVDARLSLLELTKYDPNSYSAEVHGLLAEVDYRLGNSPEAIKHYKNAIKYDDKDPRLYWNVALAYMNLSDYQNALTWASRVLGKHPDPTLKLHVERFTQDMQEKLAEQKRLAAIAATSATAGATTSTTAGATTGTTNPNQSENSSTPSLKNGEDYLATLIAEKDVHHWAPGKMPLRVHLADYAPLNNNNNNKSLYRPQFKTYVLDSLNAWSKASGGKLSFLLTRNTECDLSISFTEKVGDVTLKPGEVPVEQGLTRFLLDGKDDLGSQISKAKVTILMFKPSSGKALSDDEMKEVCLHELGHSLGITGHSQNSSDIMYFNQSFRQLPALTRRDRATMARLYENFPALLQSGVLGYSYEPIERNHQ